MASLVTSHLACAGGAVIHATDPQAINSLSNAAAGPVSIEELYYSRKVLSPAWSPDGREVVFTTNLTGRLNLWKVRAAGGWPTQLLQSDDAQTEAAWSPDGRWIAFQQDRGGTGVFDILVVPSNGGAPINLVPSPRTSKSVPRWSPDGTAIAFVWKPEAAASSDLAVFDWKSRAIRTLTHEQSGDYYWSLVAWGPDSKSLYGNRCNAAFTDCEIYRVDVVTGALTNLTPHTGHILFRASSVSADGRTLVISSNAGKGMANIGLLDVATAAVSMVTSLAWEAKRGYLSKDSKTLAYTVNEDGRLRSYILDRSSGRVRGLPFPDGFTDFSVRFELGITDLDFSGGPDPFSPDGKQLLVLHESSTEPPDLWLYDLATGERRQLTVSSIASLRARPLPSSKLVHYRAFDGKLISAFVWVPFNVQRNGKNPAIVIAHGGPGFQTVDVFNQTAAALASRGYFCIAPNVRGSTGYGIAFQTSNRQDLGGGDLQDEIYAAHFLVDTGYVDPHRIGIMGESYGGYMTLIALGKAPDIWGAGVDFYGVTDWLSESEHESPGGRQYDRSLLGDPMRDRAAYERASPTKYFANVRAPLLILQGKNDTSDPQEEAELAVASLKRGGSIVEVHYYSGEGHGFQKRETLVDSLQRTIDWFDRYLKGEH